MNSYSDKLDKESAAEKFKKEFQKIDNSKISEKQKLEDLKSKVEKSLEAKIALSKNLNAINDKEMLDEIEKVISAKQNFKLFEKDRSIRDVKKDVCNC